MTAPLWIKENFPLSVVFKHYVQYYLFWTGVTISDRIHSIAWYTCDLFCQKIESPQQICMLVTFKVPCN